MNANTKTRKATPARKATRKAAPKAAPKARKAAPKAAPVKAKATPEQIAAGRARVAAESWARPAVAAARKARHGAKVNGTVYRSLLAAMQAIGADTVNHRSHRKVMKAEGKVTVNGITYTAVSQEEAA